MQQLGARELAALCAGPLTVSSPVLLDVREAWEFKLGAILVEGASNLHVPMNEVPARLGEIVAARTNGDGTARPVVCICHHGVRSLQVVAFLERQGLGLVYNLGGGTEAWSTEVDPSLPRY